MTHSGQKITLCPTSLHSTIKSIMYICYISKNNNFTKNIPVIIFFNIK